MKISCTTGYCSTRCYSILVDAWSNTNFFENERNVKFTNLRICTLWNFGLILLQFKALQEKIDLRGKVEFSRFELSKKTLLQNKLITKTDVENQESQTIKRLIALCTCMYRIFLKKCEFAQDVSN